MCSTSTYVWNFKVDPQNFELSFQKVIKILEIQIVKFLFSIEEI